jgi:hypothetical protein
MNIDSIVKQLHERSAETGYTPAIHAMRKAIDALETMQRENAELKRCAKEIAQRTTEDAIESMQPGVIAMLEKAVMVSLAKQVDYIGDLNRELEDIKRDLERSFATSTELATELEEARKDAERYKYAREHPFIMFERFEAIPLKPDEIDEVIDHELIIVTRQQGRPLKQPKDGT